MWSFFHGWRRKAGCVTLLMACVCIVGWTRSRSLQDRFFLREKDAQCYLLTSSPDGLAWIRVFDVMGFGLRSMPFYQTQPATAPTDTANFRSQVGGYRWEWAGFRFCKGWQMMYPIEFWVVPYWAIGIPLTLLSAYLILWNHPRKTKSSDLTANPSINSN